MLLSLLNTIRIKHISINCQQGISLEVVFSLTYRNPESIKVSRSRLRKKLGLTHSNINISAFLNQL